MLHNFRRGTAAVHIQDVGANFFRHLGSALIVAAFGAILLGAMDAGGQGLTLDLLRGGAARADLAQLFRLMFLAGAVFLAAGLIAVLAIEEHPLRGPAREAAAPAAAE